MILVSDDSEKKCFEKKRLKKKKRCEKKKLKKKRLAEVEEQAYIEEPCESGNGRKRKAILQEERDQVISDLATLGGQQREIVNNVV